MWDFSLHSQFVYSKSSKKNKAKASDINSILIKNIKIKN